MIITLSEAAALKKEIAEKYHVQLHFHDGCGGQYFTLEQPSAELKKYITDYFAEKDLQAVFSENGEQFSVREIS